LGRINLEAQAAIGGVNKRLRQLRNLAASGWLLMVLVV